MRRWALLMLLVAICPVLRAADTSAAVGVVEQFHATLKQALLVPDFEDRRALIEPAVVAAFDAQTIARISTGAYWRKLDDGQREKLVQALQDLIVATYAARFVGDNGQTFETVGANEQRPGRSIVNCVLHRRAGEPIALDYLLRARETAPPRIYNVSADGVSDLSLRRAEYSAVIARDGFDALLAMLRDNTLEFAEANRRG